MCMGGLFVLEMIVLLYLVLVDPFHVRPLVQFLWQQHSATPAMTTEVKTPPAETVATDSSRETASPQKATVPPPATPTTGMTAAQRTALQSAGIDPATFANGVTPAQLNCFIGVLGASRVAEIKAGAVPTASEFFSIRSCL